MKRTQSKSLVQIHWVVSAGFCHSIGIEIDNKPPFQPPGEESKIPEIGVNLFCLKILLTEFHISNSIGFKIPIRYQVSRGSTQNQNTW